MAKLPDKYSISGVGNLASNRPMAQVDLGGEARGMQQAGAGLQNLGGSITAIGAQQAKQDKLIQGTQAETDLATDRAAREEALRNDTDYGTLTQRWAKDDGAAIQRAALRIKDPKTRELFTLEQQKSGLGYNKRLSAVADAGIKDGRIATLETAWQKSHDLIANPATPDDVRTRTKTELDASIAEGAKAGVFSEQYANDLRRKYVDGADYALAGSLVKTPDGNRAVIPAAVGGMAPDAVFSRMIHKESSGDPTALSPKGAMGLTQLMPGTARETAEKIGINLPNGSDADLHKFFATPTGQLANLAIGKAYFGDMLKRYNGDTAAAVIAYNGGPLRANKWLESGRDDSVLPAETRDYKTKILGRGGDGTPQTTGTVQPRANYATVQNMGDPLTPGWKQSNIVPVSVAGKSFEVNKAAAPAFQGFLADLQAAGYNFKTAAGYNYRNIRGSSTLSQHSFGNAIDLNAENNGQGQDKNDFGGIDVAALAAKHGLIWGGNWSGKTKDPMHFEWAGPNATGGGSSPSNDSPYATAYQNLRTRFPNLSAEQIDNLATSAVTAKNGFAVQDRAAVEQAVQDGPSALANTGRYDGPTLDRGKFQEVYGQEGDRRFNAYDAAMKTAKSTYDMQTQSQTDIMAQVEQARTLVQTTTGEGADLADKRLSALQTAAAATIAAREKDPAGYVQQAFPVVKQAWTAYSANPSDPQAYSNALTATAAAQEQLGIPLAKRTYLPDMVAKSVTETFKDETQPTPKRIGAVLQTVLSTQDKGQQRAIWQQLVKEGLPDITEGAVEAYARGDSGAGERLMTAAVSDPSKIAGKLTSGGAPVTDAMIDTQIQDTIMAPGKIGDIAYAVDFGSAENFAKAERGSGLMMKAVKARLAQNEPLDKAVANVAADMFGKDHKILTNSENGMSLRLAIPTATDEKTFRTGIAGAKLQLIDAMKQAATADQAARTKGHAGLTAIDNATIDNQVGHVVSEGTWRNYGDDGFVFINPYQHNAPVSDAKGNPIVFKMDDLLKMGTRGEGGVLAPVAPLPGVTPTAPAGAAPRGPQPIPDFNAAPAVPVAPAGASQGRAVTPPPPTETSPQQDIGQQMRDLRTGGASGALPVIKGGPTAAIDSAPTATPIDPKNKESLGKALRPYVENLQGAIDAVHGFLNPPKPGPIDWQELRAIIEPYTAGDPVATDKVLSDIQVGLPKGQHLPGFNKGHDDPLLRRRMRPK